MIDQPAGSHLTADVVLAAVQEMLGARSASDDPVDSAQADVLRDLLDSFKEPRDTEPFDSFATEQPEIVLWVDGDDDAGTLLLKFPNDLAARLVSLDLGVNLASKFIGHAFCGARRSRIGADARRPTQDYMDGCIVHNSEKWDPSVHSSTDEDGTRRVTCDGAIFVVELRVGTPGTETYSACAMHMFEELVYLLGIDEAYPATIHEAEFRNTPGGERELVVAEAITR